LVRQPRELSSFTTASSDWRSRYNSKIRRTRRASPASTTSFVSATL
jgi:hypothetical protein